MTNKYFLYDTDKVVIETARQDLRYEFEIDSKYTIIYGNSGTGKTTLCEVLIRPNYDESCKFRNKSLERFVDRKQSLPSCTVYSKYRFFVMTDAIIPLKLNSGLTWTDWINDNISEDTVICVDEDFTELYDLEFQKSVSMSNPKWIIMSRLPLCGVPFGVNDIYIIEHDSVNNVNRFKSRLAVCKSIFWDIDSLDDLNCFCKLVTEDLKSGYDFFSSFLDNIETAYGKSNIQSMSLGSKNTVFVIDGFGFGCELMRMLLVADTLVDRNNVLWDIGSFEYLIISSPFIKSYFGEHDIERFTSNKEQSCTELLMYYMDKVGLTYSKGSLLCCFTKSCCSHRIKGVPTNCNLYKFGNKIELILGHDLYTKLCSVFGAKLEPKNSATDSTELSTEFFV